MIKELCKLYGMKKTLFGLVKSLDPHMRHKLPDLLSHLVFMIFMYNTTPHCTTGIAPYTLIFCREPLISLDQILGRTDCDWNQEATI